MGYVRLSYACDPGSRLLIDLSPSLTKKLPRSFWYEFHLLLCFKASSNLGLMAQMRLNGSGLRNLSPRLMMGRTLTAGTGTGIA
jgi:hypothetical protein